MCKIVVSCSCRPLTTEVRFRSWMSPLEICYGQSGTGTGFSPSAAVFPYQFDSAVFLILHYNNKRATFGNLLNSNRPRFNSELVCAGLVVEEAALKQGFLQVHRFFQLSLFFHQCNIIIRLTPNDPYMTAPLTFKRCILYIYSTNVGTEYFKHALYSPFFSLQNAVCFIMLTSFVPVLFTFYTQGVLKLKKK